MRIIDSNKEQVPPETSGKVNGKGNNGTKLIKGLVTSIVDGNTFELSVSGHENGKRHEVIKIYGMDKPAPSTLSGILAKLELEKKIVGRTLECEIIETDDLNQLIAKVPDKYLEAAFPLPTVRD